MMSVEKTIKICYINQNYLQTKRKKYKILPIFKLTNMNYKKNEKGFIFMAISPIAVELI